MKKFVVELCVGFCASLEVEADDYEDAISKAKKEVKDDPSEYIDDVEIEGVNFIREV